MLLQRYNEVLEKERLGILTNQELLDWAEEIEKQLPPPKKMSFFFGEPFRWEEYVEECRRSEEKYQRERKRKK
jgi:hypothetical protein